MSQRVGQSFLVNLYKFILTVGMLWTDPDKLIWWMASAVVIILPFEYTWIDWCFQVDPEVHRKFEEYSDMTESQRMP